MGDLVPHPVPLECVTPGACVVMCLLQEVSQQSPLRIDSLLDFLFWGSVVSLGFE